MYRFCGILIKRSYLTRMEVVSDSALRAVRAHARAAPPACCTRMHARASSTHRSPLMITLKGQRRRSRCPPACAGPAQEAKSDLVNVLSSLEAHWHVLEAEVVEINRDIDYCEQCLRKYGEWFNSPLQYLRELKRTKKNKMKEIIRTMESFNNNLQGGKKLVKSLEKQTPVSVLQAPSTPAVIATSGGDDGPALLVGSSMGQAGSRVIRPVES